MRRILIGAVFLILLYLPLINFDNRLHVDVMAVFQEKRTLAAFPTVKADLSDFSQFPARFQEFFGDHFGFRNTLVWLNSAVEIEAFSQSPSTNVTIGQDGWLYITLQYSNIDHMGLIPLTETQLRNSKNLLEQRQRILKNMGSEYLFVVAPNKQTTYPEYLPMDDTRVQGPTRMDQFFTYMNQHSTFRPLDLRGPLLDAKRTGRVFFKADSHWNARGAQMGYLEIMREVHRLVPRAPVLTPVVRTDSRADCCNDLSNFMAAPNLFPSEGDTAFVLPKLHHTETRIPIPNSRAAYLTENTNHELPTAVILGDSFVSWYVRSLMAESFSRAVFIESEFVDNDPIQLAQTYHPDVLLTVVAERDLKLCLGSAAK